VRAASRGGRGLRRARSRAGGMQLRQKSLPLIVVACPAWMSDSGMLSLHPSQK
jgi:hypothetical protein